MKKATEDKLRVYVSNILDEINKMELHVKDYEFLKRQVGFINFVLDHSDSNSVLSPIIENDCAEACKTVVESYEGDGMENMNNRDQVMYDACKKALANHSL